MKDTPNDDNKYPIGTHIYANENPGLKLVIDDYKQRIYYCAIDGHPELKQLVYFERELQEPSTEA
jgi:hypothetical protein